jgi:hypothetical protein
MGASIARTTPRGLWNLLKIFTRSRKPLLFVFIRCLFRKLSRKGERRITNIPAFNHPNTEYIEHPQLF